MQKVAANSAQRVYTHFDASRRGNKVLNCFRDKDERMLRNGEGGEVPTICHAVLSEKKRELEK